MLLFLTHPRGICSEHMAIGTGIILLHQDFPLVGGQFSRNHSDMYVDLSKGIVPAAKISQRSKNVLDRPTMIYPILANSTLTQCKEARSS